MAIINRRFFHRGALTREQMIVLAAIAAATLLLLPYLGISRTKTSELDSAPPRRVPPPAATVATTNSANLPTPTPAISLDDIEALLGER